TKAPPPPPTPVPTSDTSERSFDEAVAVATDSLAAQLQQRLAPSSQPDAQPGGGIDPEGDAVPGQQAAAEGPFRGGWAEGLRSGPSQLDVMPFQIANLSKAQYLLTGTMARIPSSQTGAPPVFQLNLALADLKDGMVVAQSSSRARDEGLDATPTPYYRDSPV